MARIPHGDSALSNSLLSSALNLELCVPLTGLERMGSVVGLPDFSGPFCEEDYISNQESHFQEHFASQIVLRRLLVDFHGTLSQSISSHTYTLYFQLFFSLTTV
jgi:hypothetical protein